MAIAIAVAAAVPWTAVIVLTGWGAVKAVKRVVDRRRDSTFLFHTTIEVSYKVLR